MPISTSTRPSPRHGTLAALGLLACLPVTGCCNLARLWCGPDRSRWVSESYWTEEEALATFMEAIRRDAFPVIYRCLSDEFKQHHGLTGGIAASVAWQSLKEQFSGIHLLGSAEVSGPEHLAPGRARYRLEVAGYRFRVDLAERPFVEVYVARPGGGQKEVGRYLGPGEHLADHLVVQNDLEGRVSLVATHLSLPDYAAPESVRRIAGGFAWKVSNLAPEPEGQGQDE